MSLRSARMCLAGTVIALFTGCSGDPDESNSDTSDGSDEMMGTDPPTTGGTLATGGSVATGGSASGGVPEATGGDGVGGQAGTLPPDYDALNLSFEFLEVNPRAADDPPGCSLYDTSDEFREYFNSKRDQMNLVAQLFNRIMGV